MTLICCVMPNIFSFRNEKKCSKPFIWKLLKSFNSRSVQTVSERPLDWRTCLWLWMANHCSGRGGPMILRNPILAISPCLAKGVTLAQKGKRGFQRQLPKMPVWGRTRVGTARLTNPQNGGRGGSGGSLNKGGWRHTLTARALLGFVLNSLAAQKWSLFAP